MGGSSRSEGDIAMVVQVHGVAKAGGGDVGNEGAGLPGPGVSCAENVCAAPDFDRHACSCWLASAGWCMAAVCAAQQPSAACAADGAG